ncbi:MAG: radical SAM protein [Acidobacteriota bacterium]
MWRALESGADPANVPGIAARGSERPLRERPFEDDIDRFPFPAIDLLPLESYWRLGYSHGPYQGRYAFLITSRGCSLKCTFCASNALWTRRYRMRKPERVVDEMQLHQDRFGISDFHIQDDNFAHLKPRTVAIAREILRRGLKLTWLNASGTRIDALDPDAIATMAASGFRYVSVSPESGSERMRDIMKKPYDEDHHVELVRAMRTSGVRSQACFVVGYPGETDRDRVQTRRLVRRLAAAGVDELGVFIMTPLPGAEAWGLFPDKPTSDDELTYSPRFRKDYGRHARERLRLHAIFFAAKWRARPGEIRRHIRNLRDRRFEIKAEMTLYRLLCLARPRPRTAAA